MLQYYYKLYSKYIYKKINIFFSENIIYTQTQRARDLKANLQFSGH